MLVEDWRIEDNTVRPHSALGYLTPTDYAKAWTAIHPARSYRVDQHRGPVTTARPMLHPEVHCYPQMISGRA